MTNDIGGSLTLALEIASVKMLILSVSLNYRVRLHDYNVIKMEVFPLRFLRT